MYAFSCESEIDEESLSDFVTLCTQDNAESQFSSCPTDDDDLIDFDDFLTFSAILQDQPSPSDVVSACASTVPETFEPSQKTRNSPRATNVSTDPALLNSIDVPSIMSHLPSVMQARFLEKFAESAGKHFCAIVTDPQIAPNSGPNYEQLGCANNMRETLLHKKNILFDKINEMEHVFLSRGLFKS